jgi:hypothetical protein
MFKKFAVVSIVIGLIALAAVAVSAQGGGGNGNANRNGNGRGGSGNPISSACDGSATCIANPQAYNNNYNYGGPPSADTQPGRRFGQQNQQANRNMAQNGTGLYNNLPPASADALPQEIIDLMISGWLDEQHAYAVYTAIMNQLGEIAPFVNIQQAEAQHAAAWERLFERYSIPLPAVPEFDLPTVASRQEACALSAEAEVANAGLYDQMLAAFTPYPDLYQVAQALSSASELQHLPAFQNCAGA